MMGIEKIYLDDSPNGGIIVETRLRKLDESRVDALAKSMEALGLQTPITVWVPNDQDVHLIAGAHRLAAAIKLGWEKIDAFCMDLDETDRKLWEISENLHRAELTALERDQHVAEWIRLTEGKKLAQVAPVSAKAKGGRGRREGIREAARELGIDRDAARRAVKVDSLTPEAKQVARDVGLDDNRRALLKAAEASSEKQPEVLKEIAEQKTRKQPSAALDKIMEEMEDLAYTDVVKEATDSKRKPAPINHYRWDRNAHGTEAQVQALAIAISKKPRHQHAYYVVLLADLLGLDRGELSEKIRDSLAKEA
ncbi:MAG: ParB N-terminal domain-containing protein [Steroidobacteraceae bacterium]